MNNVCLPPAVELGASTGSPLPPPLPPPPEAFLDLASVSMPPSSAPGVSPTSLGPLLAVPNQTSTNSTNSAGEHIHQAIVPTGTILTDYLDYARELEESADCYLLGSILPVVAAALARTVYFQWGTKRIYPNLFTMLVGKPGDRKSSAIGLAHQIAKVVLLPNRFLSPTGSAEAYFDEYDATAGGDPDKLLICDDANPLLSTWKNTSYGENVASRFLGLYDCCPLSETFKRNLKRAPQQPEGEVTTWRHVEETSTSVLLGATFANAKFQGHQVRAGLERRFLHYVAEKPARMIIIPKCPLHSEDQRIKTLFKQLIHARPVVCQFSSDALTQWSAIQTGVHSRSEEIDGGSPEGEAILSRLNSQPIQILKVAMCFQACRAAKTGAVWTGDLDADVLVAAQRHVELCHESTGYMDTVGSRAEVREQAAVIYGRIEHDYKSHAQAGTIILSKSDLTSKFCHHDRRGALRPQELYGRIIPELIRQGRVVELPRVGKLQTYRFVLDEGA